MLYKIPKNGRIRETLMLFSLSNVIEDYLVFKNKFVTSIRALAKSILLA